MDGQKIVSTDGFVAITMDEYADLIRADLTLDTLLDVMFRTAELDWDDELRYDNNAINHVLKALCNKKYFSKRWDLQFKKRQEEAKKKLEEQEDGIEKN